MIPESKLSDPVTLLILRYTAIKIILRRKRHELAKKGPSGVHARHYQPTAAIPLKSLLTIQIEKSTFDSIALVLALRLTFCKFLPDSSDFQPAFKLGENKTYGAG